MANATTVSGERTEIDVTVGGLHLRATEKGAGSPLVVLHHSTGPFWTSFHDRLADDARVIALDMPGYGRSERPVEARAPRDLAIWCLQMLRELEVDRTALVGLGLGGWVAAEMATMSQQTFSTLTLVGSAGIKPRSGFIHDPMMAGWIDYARLSFSTDEGFDEMFGLEPAEELVDLWDYSREMTARVTWRPWMWSLQLPALLRGVETPTLVVWGDNDRIVPLDCGQQLSELLPDARLEIVAEGGHSLEIERPEALAGLVSDFVGEQGR